MSEWILWYKLTIAYMAMIKINILSNVLFSCTLNQNFTLKSVKTAFYTGVHTVSEVYSLSGLAFQTSFLWFVGRWFVLPFYRHSIWFPHVWEKHWLSAQEADLQGLVTKAPYGAGETSANLLRCSSALRAQDASHTRAEEKWIWHERFAVTLTDEWKWIC